MNIVSFSYKRKASCLQILVLLELLRSNLDPENVMLISFVFSSWDHVKQVTRKWTLKRRCNCGCDFESFILSLTSSFLLPPLPLYPSLIPLRDFLCHTMSCPSTQYGDTFVYFLNLGDGRKTDNSRKLLLHSSRTVWAACHSASPKGKKNEKQQMKKQ